MASSEHLRVFIGNFITREPSGALCSATPCTGELRFPTVRKAANRASSDAHRASSDAHRNLRIPPEPPGSTKNLRVLELRSGVRRQCLTNMNPSGFIAHRRRSSEDFGPPPVRYNRHRASSDAHRNLRIPPGSPRDPEAALQSHRLAVIELLH
jgi:hypothetical protein